MNEHERLEDPAFDRLVTADPARRAPGPVQGVLRAKVDALIAEQAEHEPGERMPAGRATAEHGPADDLAVRRHRRRTPWLVAAAVAGIVAAGGGGYMAGEQSVGETTTAAADRAADTDDSRPSVLGLPEEDAAPEAAAPQEVAPEAATSDAAGDLPTATGLVFHAGVGLSDTPATAPVRRAGTGASLGSYPVVSEVEAVERLGDPRFAGAVVGGVSAPFSALGAAPPAEGGPIAWPVQDVTIVSATLTELRYPLSDGTVLLVPAYELTDTEGNGWAVMAVDDEKLDFAP